MRPTYIGMGRFELPKTSCLSDRHSKPTELHPVMVRQDGIAPPMFLMWVIYSHLTSLLVTLTHNVTQRVTRYFEVSIFTLLANLDGGSIRRAICFTLPAALKSAIGITNICWSLSKQNR